MSYGNSYLFFLLGFLVLSLDVLGDERRWLLGVEDSESGSLRLKLIEQRSDGTPEIPGQSVIVLHQLDEAGEAEEVSAIAGRGRDQFVLGTPAGWELPVPAEGASDTRILRLPPDIGISVSSPDEEGEISVLLDDSNRRKASAFPFDLKDSLENPTGPFRLGQLEEDLRLVRWEGREPVLAISVPIEMGRYWLVPKVDVTWNVSPWIRINRGAEDGQYELALVGGSVVGRVSFSDLQTQTDAVTETDEGTEGMTNAGVGSPQVSGKIEWVNGTRVFPISAPFPEEGTEGSSAPFRVVVDLRGSLSTQRQPTPLSMLAEDLELVIYDNGTFKVRHKGGSEVTLTASAGVYGDHRIDEPETVEIDETGVRVAGQQIARVLGVKSQISGPLAHTVYSLKWDPQYSLERGGDSTSIRIGSTLNLEGFEEAVARTGPELRLILSSDGLPRLKVFQPEGNRASCCWIEYFGDWVHIPLERIGVLSRREGDLVFDEITGTLDFRFRPIKTDGASARGAFERIAIARVGKGERIPTTSVKDRPLYWDPRIRFVPTVEGGFGVDVRGIELTQSWRDSSLANLQEPLQPAQLEKRSVALEEFVGIFSGDQWGSYDREELEGIFAFIEARTPVFTGSLRGTKSQQYLYLLNVLYDEALGRMHNSAGDDERLLNARAALIIAVQMSVVIANQSHQTVKGFDESRARRQAMWFYWGNALGGVSAAFLHDKFGLGIGGASLMVLSGALLGGIPWLQAARTRYLRVLETYGEGFVLNQVGDDFRSRVRQLERSLTPAARSTLMGSIGCETRLTNRALIF